MRTAAAPPAPVLCSASTEKPGKESVCMRFLFGVVVLSLLAACGGGGAGLSVSRPPPEPANPPPPSANPAYHLATARFTTHQPGVLEQIGAHHAYAGGLTGRGVRIGIDDTIVDYTQTAEFGSRVKLRDSDGAVLAYSRPLGDLPSSDVDVCRSDPACKIWKGNSEGDDKARNSWVRQIVGADGWATGDDTVFILDEHYAEDGSIEQLRRWQEVPTPYGSGSHGTIVASVAAGTNLGVAPEATVIPIAKNLTDDQHIDAAVGRALRVWIQALPSTDRRQLDDESARSVRDDYTKFDIINRSYGKRLSQFAVIDSVRTAEWFSAYLPRTQSALWQSDVPASQKTILVYAAGNDGDRAPGLGALLPFFIPELRGHSLAVAATDPKTGAIAEYSNRCGPLPRGWNAARHGRHYCLAAPGTVRGLVPNASTPGSGAVKDGLQGTSYAAPLVSGALALLKEHFRGTRGNTEIVKRMVDTADRFGRYADLETYGAGHLDLEAALSPVGTLNAGQPGHALSRTALQTPAAFGSVAQRTANMELAAFDEQDFPFWIPVAGLISDGSDGRSPIPRFDDTETPAAPAPGLHVLNLYWTGIGDDRNRRTPLNSGWVAGFGPASASLARRPLDDGWGYGLSVEDGGYLGTEASGAFQTGLRSSMLWTSHAFEHEFGAGWKLNAVGTVALSLPQYGNDAMFRATPSMMSAMSMRVGTGTTGVVVEQPLRAESGTGAFRLENGRIENGKRLYDEFRIPLRPGARELRMTLRHEQNTLGGTFAMEVGAAVNAGHVPGERETNVGFAYRTVW